MKNLGLIAVLIFYAVCLKAQVALDKEKLFEYYQNQRYGDAAQYLKSVYGDNSDDLKALSQMGYCYLMSKNTEEAEKYYFKAYQLESKNLSTLFSLASISRRRGNVEKAKAYLAEIVKIDSNNFSVYEQLASLYASAIDPEKIKYLVKANSINPNDADIALDLAESFSKKKKYAEAYIVLDLAIMADTSNTIIQKAKLPVAQQLKKYNEVISTGEKILKNDKDLNVFKDVARAYYSVKNYQKCIDYFKILEKESMQNEMTLYYISLSYRFLKNYPMATVYTKKTIDEGISKNMGGYYALLGLIYQENGKNSLALNAFKKGLEYDVNSKVIYYRLAVIYDTKLNNTQLAKTYYAKYLKFPFSDDDKDEIEYAKYRLEQIAMVK